MAGQRELPRAQHALVVARASLYLLVVLVLYWAGAYLGGWSTHPTPHASPDQNDTVKLFNLHPTLMILGIVLSAEALLAYKAPLLRWQSSREGSKLLHAVLHVFAWLSLSIGLAAAFKSHSLKKPHPIPDLYSVHSWIGLTAFILGGLQFVVGFAAYLWPQVPLSSRQALSSSHTYWGKAVWVMFLAAILTGLQEKATFLQLGGKRGVSEPILRLPALMGLVVLAAGSAVLYVHAAAGPGPVSKPDTCAPGEGLDQAMLLDGSTPTAAA